MNRREFTKSILNQIKATVSSKAPKEIMQLVETFKKENNILGYSSMTAIVKDGFLTINNIPVERIASRTPKKVMTDREYYLEGRCI